MKRKKGPPGDEAVNGPKKNIELADTTTPPVISQIAAPKISPETRAVFDQLIDRPVAFHPCLVKITERLASGVLLSQLLYWSKAMRGNEFYKTSKELMAETGLTEMEIRGAKTRLKKRGFITTRLKRHPATTHYRIHDDVIVQAISSLVKSPELSLVKSPELDRLNHPNKIGQINQTIYSENTTKNTRENPSPPKSSDSKSGTNKKANANIKVSIDYYHNKFSQTHGFEPRSNGAAAKTFQKLLDGDEKTGTPPIPIGELKELITDYLSLPDEYLIERGYPVELLPKKIDAIRLKKKQPERGFVH